MCFLFVLWYNGIRLLFSPSDILYAFSPPSDMDYLIRGDFSVSQWSAFIFVSLIVENGDFGVGFLMHQRVQLTPLLPCLRMIVL